MRKIVLSLIASATIVFAGNAVNKTVGSTMQLMHSGMNMIAEGFYYNDKEKMQEGIEVVEKANDIFLTVDIKSFLNKKVISSAAVKNITSSIKDSIAKLKQDIDTSNITKAGTDYGKVLDSCIACHIIIRKW